MRVLRLILTRAGRAVVALQATMDESELDTRDNLARAAFVVSRCTVLGTDAPEHLCGGSGVDVICGLGGATSSTHQVAGPDFFGGGPGRDFARADRTDRLALVETRRYR
jgi:hypothetical protein